MLGTHRNVDEDVRQVTHVMSEKYQSKRSMITALAGTWYAKCEVCGECYKDWCGSSPCCGSTTVVINNIVTPEEQAAADSVLHKMFSKNK